jgi:pimeloyl-ACP methyl ester carboxylesterase
MPKISYDGLPKSAQDRLREFHDEFTGAYAMGADNLWFETVCTVIDTPAPQVVYPIAIDESGFVKFTGSYQYRDLGNKVIRLKNEVWQDGVAELADKIEAWDFVGFSKGAAQMARMGLRAPARWAATVLTGTTPLSLYNDEDANVVSTIPLFSSGHLVNPLKTGGAVFDNSALGGVGGFTLPNVTAWDTYFGGLKAPNGESLGLQFTHILVPRARYVEAKAFFRDDTLLQAVRNQANSENVGGVMRRNPYVGAIEVIVADELSSSNVVYPLALNRANDGLTPILIMKEPDVETNVLDKSSYLWQQNRKVAVNAVLKGSAGGFLPHPIAKVTIS